MQHARRRDFLARSLAAGAASARPLGSTTGGLIANGDFSRPGEGNLPADWDVVCPNPAVAPLFRVEERGGRRFLAAAGNGRRESFGYVRQRVRLEKDKTYRLGVDLRYEGLEDLNRHLLHGIFDVRYKFNNGIFEYRRTGAGSASGEHRFPGPAEPLDAEVRLYFRFSAHGRVWWERVSLEECEPIPPRRVTIACREGALPKGAGPEYWAAWLDEAGRRKADLALLPEMFNGRKPRDPEPLDGPSANLLARKAQEWKMFTCASFYEKRGDLVYNTAPLFDRQGRLVGAYEKNFPYDPELDDGVTPGVRFPVFDTGLGRVGIMICYDSWFPETARILARRGAELILFPNAGYFVDLMPARASDNGVWIAVSSLNHPAGVWDSGGARAGEPAPSPTRDCRSSIVEFHQDPRLHMIVATVDLSIRYSPAWHGGPMESAPGGRRVRGTRMEALEDELAREVRRWWIRPAGQAFAVDSEPRPRRPRNSP